MYRETHQRIGALLVSPLRTLHTAVAGILSTSGIDVECERDTERAIAALDRDCAPVVLLPSDVNSERFLDYVRRSHDCPSFVVLLNAFDAQSWAEALKRGAFEAVPLNASRDRLVDTVRRAFHRSERRRLVRAALEQNPLSHADLPY